MFSRIRGFLSRHRRKFIVGSIVIGGIVFLTRYTQRKLREYQENEIKILMETTKKRQYFESTERTCNQTILSLAATLRNSIIKETDTEAIISQLKDGSADKIASWNQLKVLAVTRSAVIIYSYTMLVTFLRIQLNLISGYMYKSVQSSTETDIQSEVQAKYLEHSSYFIYESVKELTDFIKSKVDEVIASWSLLKQLTWRDLEQMYWAIISSISADSARNPVKKLTRYMLHDTNESLSLSRVPAESSVYANLIIQTIDISESEEVQDLMQKCIRSGFVLFVDHLATYFDGALKANVRCTQQDAMLSSVSVSSGETGIESLASTSSNKPTANGLIEFVDTSKTTMALAKIIPILNGQIPDNPLVKDLAADWLQRLVLNDDLKTLGANIYEAVSQQ
ncbi:peroxisomal biogenesis factor 3 [Pseudomyrmex gracilis]|uniref:peroxisomal biogenesis factor 3 n=1 Tax=Pseudomyrmex gracilis TaxID=219809 RepID=UPI0009950366|nr:peroxisomal biogenesis factor 3 [Pseudomyrmex gracilis]